MYCTVVIIARATSVLFYVGIAFYTYFFISIIYYIYIIRILQYSESQFVQKVIRTFPMYSCIYRYYCIRYLYIGYVCYRCECFTWLFLQSTHHRRQTSIYLLQLHTCICRCLPKIVLIDLNRFHYTLLYVMFVQIIIGLYMYIDI